MRINATMLTKLRAALAAAVFLTGASVQAQTAGEITMKPGQARAFAAAMLRDGKPALAAQLAHGLLQRDPADASAHFILARAYQQMHRPQEGRRAAAQAFRHARSPLAHFRSSQLAATLAYESARPGLAQLWLRRSWNHAPDEKARDVLKRDYRVLRALNPWSLQARFSVQPSDNVNNGAEDPYFIIDGLPFVGILSGDAQALSGIKMTGDLTLGYRISGSKDRQTRLSGRLYLSRVSLSDAARAQAPDARNSDFAYTRFELSAEHQKSLGKGRGALGYQAGLSHSWLAGADHQNAVRLGLTRQIPLSKGKSLLIATQIERVLPAGHGPALNRAELRMRLSQKTKNGGHLSYGLTVDLTDSDSANSRRQRLSAVATYAWPKPVGPARLSLSLGGAVTHYPDYLIGWARVPGGREDRSLFGSVDLVFDALDYAGFVPSLKLHAQKTQSNVSRFETKELSVSLGVVSKF